MSWLLNLKERMPVNIDGFHFSISPCRPDREGNFQSYACFIDIGHPLCEADRYRAVVILMDAIMDQGFEPSVQPDRRPLPPVNGIKRCVGGHMVYANPIKHSIQIKPKGSLETPSYSKDMTDLLENFGSWHKGNEG